MKAAFPFLALAGFALAKPLTETVADRILAPVVKPVLAPVVNLLKTVVPTADVSGGLVDTNRKAAVPANHAVPAGPVVDAVQSLHDLVFQRTAKLNDTMRATKDKTVVGNAATAELGLIVVAVKEVVLILKAIGGVAVFTVAEVALIAGLLFAILNELVCTILAVLEIVGVGIFTTLAATIKELGGVLFSLLLTVDGLVGGVLHLVTGLVGSVLAVSLLAVFGVCELTGLLGLAGH